MTIQQIRKLYDAQPFQSFIIHLADGREIPVPSREYMMPAPNGRTMVVYQSDSTANFIDLPLVTDLEVKPAANGARPHRRSKAGESPSPPPIGAGYWATRVPNGW